MGPGQHDVRRHRTDCDRLVLDIGNVVIGWPVVGHQAGLAGHGAEHESVDLLLAEALDHLQSGASWRAAVDFDRSGDEHLADPTAACRQNDLVLLGAERDDRLIGLDDAAAGTHEPSRPTALEKVIRARAFARKAALELATLETDPRTRTWSSSCSS